MGAAIRRRAFLGLLCSAMPSTVLGQSRPASLLLVKAGRLLDVHTGRTTTQAALLVRGDRG